MQDDDSSPGRERYLVTGASGFIGSHVCELLVREGHSVRALVHYNSRGDFGNLELLDADVLDAIEVVRGDVRDGAFVRRTVAGCDVVIHLAALIAIPHSYVAPESFLDTNVRGTLHVLEAARDAGCRRVVATSTSEVYGTARYVPMDEAHPLAAQSPYAASKIAADQLTLSYHCSFELPALVLRPFNTFGPRQSARAVIPTIISAALARGEVELGSLAPRRDFLYVEDTARAFLLAATTSGVEGEVLQVGTGVDVSIGEVAHTIFEVLGLEPRIHHDESRVRPDASEVMRLCASADLARERLGWAPRFDLAAGLARTADWIRDHLDRYKPELYLT